MLRIAYGLRPLGFDGFTSQPVSDTAADRAGEGIGTD